MFIHGYCHFVFDCPAYSQLRQVLYNWIIKTYTNFLSLSLAERLKVMLTDESYIEKCFIYSKLFLVKNKQAVRLIIHWLSSIWEGGREGERGGKKVRALTLQLFNDIRWKVLACCVNVLQINATFNMATLGTSEHSRKRLARMTQNALMNRIFLTLRASKSAKRPSDIRLTSVKTVW